MKSFVCLAGLVLIAGLASAAMPDGLVLRFSCDDLRNNGTQLPDTTGSNNTGRATGVRVTSGRLNGCCEFTGKNSFVQVPSSPLLESGHVTFCLWVRVAKAESPDRTLIEKQAAKAGYALRLVADGNAAHKGKLRATVGEADCLSDAPVADNAWHHAAVTYDGETVKLYVDGVLQKQTAAWRGNAVAKGSDLMLGMSHAQASSKNKEISFEGMLDEVLIFNRALAEAEVKDALTVSKPTFTKWQVERRLKELQELYDRGLLTQEFYDRKVKECEVPE